MLASLLAELEIPVLVRRATIDVPDMLAGGPRELLVPADRALEARALLDPMEPIDETGEPGRGAPESPATSTAATFGAGLSLAADPAEAAREARGRAARPRGRPPTRPSSSRRRRCARTRRPCSRRSTASSLPTIIGSMGEAIVAEGQEVEDGPALAVWAARLPGAEVILFRLVARPRSTAWACSAGLTPSRTPPRATSGRS